MRGREKRHIAILALAMAGVLQGEAQLKEQVNVAGEYEPLVIEVEKIGTYPANRRFEMPPLQLEYETTGIVTNYRPSLLAMGVTGWKTDYTPYPYRGYVSLGLGSYLNSHLNAGYRILNDRENSLGVALRFCGTSLYRAPVPENYAEASKREKYDGEVMLDYTHLFNRGASLNAAAKYRLAYFNYYGCTYPLQPNDMTVASVPTQTLNEANASLEYRSSQLPFSGWFAHAGIDYFGYNSFVPVDYLQDFSLKGDKETRINVGTGINIQAGKGILELCLDGNFLFYGKRDVNALGLLEKKDYGMLTLRPAYRLQFGNLVLSMGAKVDFSYGINGDTEHQDYGPVHASPDVTLDYRKDSFGLHVGLTGGSTLMTLAQRETYNYYSMPYLATTQPMHLPLDASLQLHFGPFSGFTASVEASYVIANHTPMGGWYQVMLGSAYDFRSPIHNGVPLYDLSRRSLDLRGEVFGLSLGYSCSPWIEISLSGKYASQEGEKGVFNGYDRPEWLADADIRFSPLKWLDVELGLYYRGNRSIYTFIEAPGSPVLASKPLDDLTDLKAGITVKPLDNLGVFCRATNLLNRKTDMFPGLPAEGIAVTGGLEWQF